MTIYGYGAVSRLAGRRLPLRWQHVLVWGGLRGTIALALVLSLPQDVPGRETLEVVTFGVVLLSLVGQGLTIPWLARRLGLVGAEEPVVSAREREALLDGFVVAHEELDRLQETGELPRAEREHLAQTIEAQEAILLEGIDPVTDEPLGGRGGAPGGAARRAARAAPPHRGAPPRRRDPGGHGQASSSMRSTAASAMLGERLACEAGWRGVLKEAT